MKARWKPVAIAGVALLVIGIAVAWSGLINVAASKGHWNITDQFLHWAMRMSVRTWAALTVEEPAADPSGLVSAAGHYATTCAFCHGAPGEPPSRVMQSATPAAPDLADTAGEWSDAQLHWIVKHGVKFTPMPAWPTQDRDDEVRRMTAFVRRLPEMTSETYRELAYGSGRAGGVSLRTAQEALPDCERCHAEDGRDQDDVPVLAGQKPGYLLATLRAYKSGARHSGVMGAAAARLDPDTMAAVADHYASLQPRLSALVVEPADSTAEDRVRRIVERGLPEANLPACSKCHGEGKRPQYPLLGGQKQKYMVERLRRWRGDATVVDARKSNESMPMIARRIPEDMIEPLAAHFARQSPRPLPQADEVRQAGGVVPRRYARQDRLF
jgi:cytochrome c553